MDKPKALDLVNGVYLFKLGTGYKYEFIRGKKQFELTNHLGNVLATISDKKIGVSSDNKTIDYYVPDVVTATDYAPFGMDLVGRSYNSNYPYSFNGKRDDKEIGIGYQDYGMRTYDKRTGRFISVDPLTKKYPELTPYQFASNTPIQAIDLDGLEAVVVMTGEIGGTGNSKKGSYYMYKVQVYENTTLEQYKLNKEQGILKQPDETFLLSGDAWRPTKYRDLNKRYGSRNETPPGVYHMEYNSQGFGSKKYKIKISDERGKDEINGPDGLRTGVRWHQYSPFDAEDVVLLDLAVILSLWRVL